MNWDEDADFMAGKKVAPKQGRRAGNLNSPEKSERMQDTVVGMSNNSPPEALLRTRKTGKWGDDGGKSAKSRNTTNLLELERFQTEKIESDDDIPIIPDIEEFQDDLTSSDEVEPPTVAGMKSTYRELDSELMQLHNHQKFDTGSKIDLSVLTSRLYPEKEMKDPDEEWTMDYLLETIMKSVNK